MALYGGGIARWGKDIRDGDPRKNQTPMVVRNVGDNLDKKNAWRDSHKWFKELKQECKMICEKLWNNNREFINLVCDKTRIMLTPILWITKLLTVVNVLWLTMVLQHVVLMRTQILLTISVDAMITSWKKQVLP